MSRSLTPQEAIDLVIAECRTLGAERVELSEALGRTLAGDFSALLSIPPFDNSAMDGFAVRAQDANAPGSQLVIAGESRAGHPYQGSLQPGEAIRVSTGAMIPDGADAVVRVELTTREGPHVTVAGPVASGTDLRRAGDDMKRGDAVLKQGTLIDSASVAVLAANGQSKAECSLRPSVAIVTTGDELRPPGRKLGAGEIFNSNGPALAAQAIEAGAVTGYQAHVSDSLDGTTAALAAALDSTPELLLISGGVSVGVHDHVKPALAELEAHQIFWGVAQRPGHPLWFGTSGTTLIFGLPGNPVSAMVCFHVYVRRAIDRLLGSLRAPRMIAARLASDFPKQPGRVHFARCLVELASDGAIATPIPNQGSHALTSLTGVDGLAILEAGQGPLGAGDQVLVELF